MKLSINGGSGERLKRTSDKLYLNSYERLFESFSKWYIYDLWGKRVITLFVSIWISLSKIFLIDLIDNLNNFEVYYVVMKDEITKIAIALLQLFDLYDFGIISNTVEINL